MMGCFYGAEQLIVAEPGAGADTRPSLIETSVTARGMLNTSGRTFY